MFVSTAAVVGAGTMGGEIAQAIASADIDVLLKDIDQAAIDTGLARARSVTELGLSKLVAKGKMTEEQAQARTTAVLSQIHPTLDYDGFGAIDLVVEAVPEQMELKQAVHSELDDLLPGHAILASNTSCLAMSEIADVTARPDKVIGLHFFYPASMAKLVEVVEGPDTSPETLHAALAFLNQIGRSHIVCGEAPGFVVNRILFSALSEIMRYQDATGTPHAELDAAMEGAGAVPIGPFRLLDLLGLDTLLHVSEHLQDNYGDRVFLHPELRTLVAAGHLGNKTGRGYFDHAA